MRNRSTRAIVGLLLLTGVLTSGLQRTGLLPDRLAGQLVGNECADGIDNDGDGGVDQLVSQAPDMSATRTFGSLGRGAMDFIYTELALFPYNNSQTIDDDALTTQRVCQLAGFKTVQSVTKRNFSSCGDNLILYWNGSSWISGAACSRDGFISTLVCAGRVAQCDNGKDDDFDGQIDTADGGCVDATDTSEGPHDSYCTSSSVQFESPRQCQDGIDNNDNGLIDYPADPGCDSATDNDENSALVLDPASPAACTLAIAQSAPFAGSSMHTYQMANGSDGSVWAARGDGIAKMAADGRATFYPVADSGNAVNSIAVLSDGSVWYNGAGTGKIGRMTAAGAMSTLDIPAGRAADIAVGPDGNLWATLIGDFETSIAKITPSGAVTKYAVRTGAGVGSVGYRAIAAGADGFLYVTDERVGTVTKISASGVVTTVSFASYAVANGSVTTSNSAAEDIAKGFDGNVWFTIPASYSVAKLTPAGAVTVYPVPQQSGRPVAIVAGTDRMWFTTVSGREGGIGSISGAGIAGVLSSYYNVNYFGVNVSRLTFDSSGLAIDGQGNVWHSYSVDTALESAKVRVLTQSDKCTYAAEPVTPSFYATAPDGTYNDANGVVQVPSGSSVQLTWNVPAATCTAYSVNGSTQWGSGRRFNEWLTGSPGRQEIPCAGTTALTNVTSSQTYYINTTSAEYKVSVVVKPGADPVAGIGGAAANTIRAYGPSGETSDANGVIQVPSGSNVFVEWNNTEVGWCNAYSIVGSTAWGNNYTFNQWLQGSVGRYSVPCAGIVGIPNVTSSQTYYINNDSEQRVSIVVKPASGPVAGLGTAPAGTMLAYGPSGETTNAGTLTAPAGSALTFEWKDSGTGWCSAYATSAVPGWGQGSTAKNQFYVPCTGILSLANLTAANSFKVENGVLRQVKYVPGTPSYLVGHWNFDTATATAAPDSSGNGNNGIVVGATPLNGCMQFDGTNDYINLGAIGQQLTQNTVTFAAWAKKEDGGGGGNPPSGNSNFTPVLISSDYGGVGYLSTTGPATVWGIGGDGALSTSPVNPGTFYHIAVTTDAQNIKLYINGVLNSTKTLDRPFSNIPGNVTLGVGSLNNLANLWAYFKGTMDDVRLYNKVLTASEIAALAAVRPSCDTQSYSCKAAEFDAAYGSFATQGWTEQKAANATITGPSDDAGTKYIRIADNSTTGGPNASLPIPRSVLQDADFTVEMKARIVSSSTGRPDLTGATALYMAPDGRYIGLYFDTNKFGTIKNLAWAQTVSRNTSDAFHTYRIAYKKNATGVSDDTFDVYFDGEKVLADVKLSDVAYIPAQSSDSLTVGGVSTDGTGTIDVSYVRFWNNANPCVTYNTVCGVAEFYAQDGTFEQQGWTTVSDSNPDTNLTGPSTQNGVTYVRLSDLSATSGMRTSKLDISNSMLADRDWTIEMKSRTVQSDPNGYVLGMNMLLVTPDNVSTSLFIEPGKFGMQAATPNAYTWGPAVSRNTSDAFHTYVIKNKKNAAGASDDTIDVYFDGAKVLSDIPRSQLYVYDAGTGVQGISFGIGSSPGKGVMDVSYVTFKNDESSCPANPFKKAAVQCSDGIDNDGDGKIDYWVQGAPVKTFGPVVLPMEYLPAPPDTPKQLKPFTIVTGLTGGQQVAIADPVGGTFINSGYSVPCGPIIGPGKVYIPVDYVNDSGLVVKSEVAWGGVTLTVPAGATQMRGYAPIVDSSCTLSGSVYDPPPNFDPDCTSASDDSEAAQVCTDSDGGNNPSQKGFVNASGGPVTTASDACNVNGTLQEYFCDASNLIKVATASCDPGSSCVDGACKAGSSSSIATVLNPSRTGFGGIAFDGNDMIFMPLKNGDNAYHGNVLSFGPVCKPGVCGDGVPTSDEQCDDGNTKDGDGCNAKCIWEPYARPGESSSSSSRSSASASSASSSSSRSSVSSGSSSSISSSRPSLSSSSSVLSSSSSLSSSSRISSVSSASSSVIACVPGTLCPDGSVCPQNGQCPVGSSSSSAMSGAGDSSASSQPFNSCDVNANCPSNLCISGYCTCTNSAQCGGNACIGGFCTNIPSQDALAFDSCRNNAECPTGMLCTGGSCMPDASFCGNGVIDPGEICDDGNGEENDSCTTRCFLGPNMACTNPRQCQSLICKNGVCGTCASDNECPDGMACVSGACTTANPIDPDNDGMVVLSDGFKISASLFSELGTGIRPENMSYEQYIQLTQQHAAGHAPVGSTGPETVAIMAAGASAGYTWMKMRRRKS